MSVDYKLYLREMGEMAKKTGLLSPQNEEDLRISHTLLKINYTLAKQIESEFEDEKIKKVAETIFGERSEYNIIQKALSLQVNKWHEKRLEFLNEIKEMVKAEEGKQPPKIFEADLPYIAYSLAKKNNINEMTNIELIMLKNKLPEKTKEVEVMEKRLSIRGEDMERFKKLPFEKKLDVYKGWIDRQKNLSMVY